MIALLLAHGAFAQDPTPVEPPPAEPIPEPAPPEETPPPVEQPAADAVEPAWEAVTVDPEAAEPVAPIETTPDGQLNLTPWVSVPDDPRGKLLRFGIAAEVGSLGNDDQAYDLFSESDSMGSAGVALSYVLANHLAIVGSWHHFRHGATVVIGGATDTDSDADFQSSAQELRSAWLANEGTLGLRVDASIRDVLFPYVTAQGMVLGARLRLDDDPTVNDNPGQVQASGFTQGVMGTAGFELRIPPQSKVQAAWTLEFGHGWLARTDFGAFGSMQPGGFVARSGLGVRF